MFQKLLIANRGEIACRIIRTCQRLGIKTVAVYSDADADALHVKMADEAVRLGKPVASESYLDAGRIIKAAKSVKADAIHPGYGFLSESSKFARAVESAGIVFVGPPANVIEQMGDKVAARKLAREAGVPVVSGTPGEVTDQEALEAAPEIGFPLMVKAADGGGGMGIRVVEHIEELTDALTRARAQAQGAFGSNRVYLERRVENASHVEVQVIGDKHGNVVHLYERDCSVQRRNQKVVEETPCAKLTAQQREALTEAAVRLARSIGYYNAGTMEFLLGQDGQFYFMEMNTRLQVEHPITEMATGLDIVELQLLVAAGEELPIKQEDVRHVGAAFEARIYPEDPETLMPAAGVVTAIEEPRADYIRVDGAIYPGYAVQPYYEPMMAKLAVWGADRQEAIARFRQSLEAYKIRGVVTNIPLLLRVAYHQDFVEARHDTRFLDKLIAEAHAREKETIAAMAVAMAIAQDRELKALPSKWKMRSRRLTMINRLGGGVV